MAEREEIEVFLQGEGVRDILLLKVKKGGTVRDILEAAREGGLAVTEGVLLWIEDEESSIDLDAPIASTQIRHRGRVHVHRCHKVAVTVTFNGASKSETFPPAATIKRVKRWATGPKGFNMTDVDAAEHVLQLAGSSVRPDEDTHVGTLVHAPQCAVSFDLVPKVRVEG